jgi:outer membrane protein assembly factor BamD
MMTKWLRLNRCVVLLAALTILFSGCALDNFWSGLFGQPGSEIEAQPQDLAHEGMEHLQARRYSYAVDSFQKLKDRYPYSRYAILAELKIADALFLKGDYIEAMSAYQQFESLHPNNEAVPYVIYQIGLCHYEMITGFDRDQRPTVEAIQTFTRLIQTYPASRYAAMAEGRITEAQAILAHHEFYIGEFYYKMDAYEAAMGRFISLVKNYPDAGFHTQALEYIRICRQKIAEGVQPEKYPDETTPAGPIMNPDAFPGPGQDS